MSRIAGLLTKRRGTEGEGGGAASASSPSTSPEKGKDRDRDAKAKSRSARSPSVISDGSNGRPSSASLLPLLSPSASASASGASTSSPVASKVMRRRPSAGELRHSAKTTSIASDGTPLVHDSSYMDGHHDSTASTAARRTSIIGNGHNNRTSRVPHSSNGGPDASNDGTAHHYLHSHDANGTTVDWLPQVSSGGATSAGQRGPFAQADQGIGPGEGSLSLDALIGPGAAPPLMPKSQSHPLLLHPTLNGAPVDGHDHKLRLSTSSSTSDMPTPRPSGTAELRPLPLEVEDTHPVNGSVHRRSYPPVFEHSDVYTSSSSSSAASTPALGAGPLEGNAHASSSAAASSSIFPVIQIERTASNESRPPSRRQASTGSALLPSAAHDVASEAQLRARSASASSSTSGTAKQSANTAASGAGGRARTSSRPPMLKKKSSRTNASMGISGALAYSGMQLAQSASALQGTFPGAGQANSRAVPAVPSSRQQSLEPVPTDDHAFITFPPAATEQPQQPFLVSRSSEEAYSGYESPAPISNYTPNDSPRYDDDPTFHAMTSMDALGDFEDVVGQLGAGYALASSKRNADFHAMFKNIPEDDFLIEDYGCALQREILCQGRLYISEHHLCFYANIFGWVTTLVLAFNEVIAIEKRNTALVIPNAIHIATMHSRNTFASFLSRDMTYDLIVSLWRNQHPEVPASAALPDAAGITDDEEEFGGMSNADERGNEVGDGNEPQRKKQKTPRKGGRFRRNKATSNATPANIALVEGEVDGKQSIVAVGNGVAASASRADTPAGKKAGAAAIAHAPTQCNCDKGGTPHLATTVMDATFPGSPEKLYNLIFTSGFMRDFLCNDMQLTDLQIGDWAPQKSGSNLLTRTYKYIKPLSAPVGPKSAQCILVDENLHVDFDDFVVTLTTTRTPEVPSGGSFAVKTKTCLTWARNNSTRVLVTTTVDWTGRSFIRGIIDRSSIDGQKALYIALEQSVRAYIAQHRTEFYAGGDEGGEEASDGEDVDGSDRDDGGKGSGLSAANGRGSGGTGSRPGSSGGRGDGTGNNKSKTATGPSEPLAPISNAIPQLKPVCDFLTTLWDMLGDAAGQMSVTALVCSGVILVLVVSNLFTLSSLRKSSSRYVPSRRPPPNYAVAEEGLERWKEAAGVRSSMGETSEVAAAVRGVLQDYFAGQWSAGGEGGGGSSGGAFGGAEALGRLSGRSGRAPQEEVESIKSMLDELEVRISRLKASLEEVD